MGVAAVWEVTKRGFDERQPFSVLVTNFYKEHGRPIRIAIDAYQWIFEAGSLGQSMNLPSATRISKLIQNFHARIRELISLNVSFVLVFDGRFKPNFKRNVELQKERSIELEDKDFDSEYLKYKELSERNGNTLDHVNDLPDIAELKRELTRWNIDYVEAPSEGEAEASRLQRVGVVDYVLSNDSDSIIFGATKILRNFSRFEDDKPAGATGIKDRDEYWCTPVNMSAVKRKTGFDRWRILLFSILTGADYNNGVKNIGSEKAFQLALSSTEFITRHIATCPYEEFPDFSTQLKQIYYRDDGLPQSDTRRTKYKTFQADLFKHVSENILEYFGRNERAMIKDGYFDNFPPDYVVMLYYYPLLKKDIFQFKEGSTNFAETKNPQSWFDLPKFQDSLVCFKKTPPPNVTDVDIWFTRILTEAYLLKHIIHDVEVPAVIEKMKTKEIGTFDLDQLSVRFKHFFPFGEIEDPEDSDTKKTKKGHLKWIPKDLVPTTSKYYTDYLEREEAKRKEEEEKAKSIKKRSPRKKKPTQASTLISMGFIDAPTIEKHTPMLQRKKSVGVQKQSTTVLDMLKVSKDPKTPILPPALPPVTQTSPTKSQPLFVEEDFESDFSDGSIEEIGDPAGEIDSSPLKPNKTSPTKIETEVKSAIQESPIKVKSRKQEHNTSPSKGSRTYEVQDLEEDTAFSRAKKKLDFTKVQNTSTPMKKTPLENFKTTQEEQEISIITISDTSMANDSSLMEISQFSKSNENESPKKQTIPEKPENQLKNYSALDDILKPIEYSSDDSD
ncbi:hypothetical protein WICANDRAFT_68326 [Wickerhamomyces anomalus NRRL Y-366-8]|uniref:XPG-I domain-containing protein n=1 Tax=Wickerhamomyces anomalus (strain ATCC 58044 / CBS 1984 / NCYC 433 / NRRL Y-366-8) TaxID=683960 RepID=A0A1E3P2M1_WICAA|nr:uncharacterized protein WICANDRAFT_68326 [Wickerhamomyces anomalus NRRL Y-366-8]ODQ59739.1 hypothetical protein WICANDRAFT_68326 [Wickerhamomyces anomalus NRRL Y-366-8]